MISYNRGITFFVKTNMYAWRELIVTYCFGGTHESEKVTIRMLLFLVYFT